MSENVLLIGKISYSRTEINMYALLRTNLVSLGSLICIRTNQSLDYMIFTNFYDNFRVAVKSYITWHH
jgi:hypothetical protein